MLSVHIIIVIIQVSAYILEQIFAMYLCYYDLAELSRKKYSYHNQSPKYTDQTPAPLLRYPTRSCPNNSTYEQNSSLALCPQPPSHLLCASLAYPPNPSYYSVNSNVYCSGSAQRTCDSQPSPSPSLPPFLSPSSSLASTASYVPPSWLRPPWPQHPRPRRRGDASSRSTNE